MRSVSIRAVSLALSFASSLACSGAEDVTPGALPPDVAASGDLQITHEKEGSGP